MKPHKEIIICPMNADDISEILDIQAETGLSFWSEKDYKNEIENKQTLTRVIKLNGRIIGFAVVRLLSGEKDQNAAEIYNIALRQHYQGKGFGQKLFDNTLLELRKQSVSEVWLEVRESNEKAIKFYRKNGFEKEFVRKNYYQNPMENAFVMKLRVA